MVQRRDNRYRGRQRRRTAPQRKPGHLRTNYTENDYDQFVADMYIVRSVWPEEVREADRKAAMKYNYKAAAISTMIPMVGVTILAVLMAISGEIPWWMVPVAQSVFLIYLALIMLLRRKEDYDEDFDIIIYREADRRGIKYDNKMPHYALMNKINADYNSHLWNRNFKWK